MKIVALEKNQSEIARNFILPYEFSCVQIANMIRKGCENLYVVLKGDDFSSKSDIYGIFSFDGTMHHCFPFFTENPLLFENFVTVFIEFVKNHEKKIKCMNGLEGPTNVILNILRNLKIVPYQSNEYELLVLKNKLTPPPEKLMNDDFIKRCTIDDQEELSDLQKQYLIVEVAPVGKEVSDLENNVILKQILKNQICLAMVCDENFVAKANTNAIGWNYVQIGGVFTKPLFRKNYYAWYLVYNLCDLLISRGKKVSLFVKKKNQPALNLYERIGFSEAGQYKICYFN